MRVSAKDQLQQAMGNVERRLSALEGRVPEEQNESDDEWKANRSTKSVAAQREESASEDGGWSVGEPEGQSSHIISSPRSNQRQLLSAPSEPDRQGSSSLAGEVPSLPDDRDCPGQPSHGRPHNGTSSSSPACHSQQGEVWTLQVTGRTCGGEGSMEAVL